MRTPTFKHLASSLGALAITAGLLSGGAATAAAAPDSSALPTRFDFQKVSAPDPKFTQLLGINNNDWIVGYKGDMNADHMPNQGIVLKPDGSFITENFPNAAQTQIVGVNGDGDVVGFYFDAMGNQHGWMKSKDFVTVDLPGSATVNQPGGAVNQLLGINSKDQAAGYYQDAAGLQHAYVYNAKDGTFLVLNIPMPSSQATGINNDGTVVGFEQASPQSNESSGYILKDGKLTILNVPGSTFTQALGINNRGDVVGTFTDSNGSHGFFYRDGGYQQIDVPESTSTVVNGLNDKDRIVGFFMDKDGNTVGLIGTPATTSVNGKETLTFDDLSKTGQPLNGEYPADTVNWGQNVWFLSGPYGKDSTNSISFNGAGPTSATFTSLHPRILGSVDAINGGNSATTVTLSCLNNPTVSAQVGPHDAKTISTNWTNPCNMITVGSTNGWETNFDNIVLITPAPLLH